MDADNCLQLLAPLSGELLPLEQVPDRTFAQKSVGNGIAIRPTSSTLLAPCNGKVVLIHPAGHAVSLHTEQGVELLLHVGLDTAKLDGEGFDPQVSIGDKVKAGQTLIQFDAKHIAAKGHNLITPLIITNGEKVAHYQVGKGVVKAGQSTLLSLSLRDSAKANNDHRAPVSIRSKPAIITNTLGLHARPAAALARIGKKFMSQLQLEHNGKTVDCKSLLAIMALNVQQGDQVCFKAAGQDAAYAIQALTRAVKQGLGQELYPAQPIMPSDHEEPLLERPSSGENILVGVPTLPQIAVGTAHQWHKEELRFNRVEYAKEPPKERERLNQAIVHCQSKLQQLAEQLQQDGNEDDAAILTAHFDLLVDPALCKIARAHLSQGTTAEYAWYDALQSQVKKLRTTENPLLVERADDFQHIGQRVLQRLQGIDEPIEQWPKHSILLMESLSPAEAAQLDPDRVAGLVTTQGSATSHAALLARSKGLLTLTAAPEQILQIPNGQLLILDGIKGELHLKVSEQQRSEFLELQQKQQIEHEQARQDAMLSAETVDGHPVQVMANIASASDAFRAIQHGAEGVGLLRSEFLYLAQYTEPDEEQQAQVYVEIAELLGADKTLIIRTLDAGGDKPLHYLPIPPEKNPVLGERGIRIGLHHPAMFRRQVRAILRASRQARVKIMFPMIATLPELRAAKKLVEEEASRLCVTNYELGIMVEVPSAALLASHFAAEIDFLSIGTNDLTQYTLAMDRGHPDFSWQVDALDPSILKLIELTVKGAKQHGKQVAICGAAASDPMAIPLLLGLGVMELSCDVSMLPQVKQQIRRLSLAKCQQLAQQALQQADASSVRELLCNAYLAEPV